MQILLIKINLRLLKPTRGRGKEARESLKRSARRVRNQILSSSFSFGAKSEKLYFCGVKWVAEKIFQTLEILLRQYFRWRPSLHKSHLKSLWYILDNCSKANFSGTSPFWQGIQSIDKVATKKLKNCKK